jgi:hypothetical protein
MNEKPTNEQLVDLMIDLMAELEGIEIGARKMRERLELISITISK